MPTDRHNDEALVARAQSGDLAAFEELVRAHTRSVYVHAVRFFGDEHAAEDVVQEVFIKVYRSLASFDGSAAFSTWLFRVTRNACLDAVRSNKRRPVPIDPADVALETSADDLADGVTASVALESGMRALPPEDRDALQAVTVFALSYAEAAEVLGVPAGTVKSRVFRARRALVALLGIDAGGEP